MPWTFAHPAAILPLRRYCPRRLHFPALVIGSLTPDFGYYLRWLDLARLAHRFPDGLAVCVLSGLLLLAWFYALREPVCRLLPQPHRGALLGCIVRARAGAPNPLLTVVLSLALGAATHMAWDGLTHRGGWAVMQALALQEPLFRLWGTGIPAYQCLQQLSTLAGISALVWAYVRWLRAATPDLPLYAIAVCAAREERWRYRLLGATAAAALICALFVAASAATRSPGQFLFDRFVFRLVVDFTAALVLLLALSAMLYRLRRPTLVPRDGTD